MRTTYFIYSDWLGTERARTTTTGAPYETCTSLPFGDWLTCSGGDPSPMHFTSKERDSESGLDNFGARYYSSSTGRFISVDPSNLSINKSNPQSWNRYSYTYNNPLKYVDQNGQWPTDIHNQIIDRAFKGRLSDAQVATIKKASAGVDHDLRTQTNSAAFIHGMKAPGQSDQEAKSLADHRTSTLSTSAAVEASQTTGWSATRADGGGGLKELSTKALDIFGQGAHTIMDETSPAHRDKNGNPLVWDIKPPSLDAAGAAIVVAGVEAHEETESTITDQQLTDAAQKLRDYFANTFSDNLNKQAVETIEKADKKRTRSEEKLMQKIRFSSSSILGGITIGFLAVTLPVFLFKFTDLAVYAWLPGTSLVSLLGGGGLHDRHGILFFLTGVVIEFFLYSIIAILALEYISRCRKARVGHPN